MDERGHVVMIALAVLAVGGCDVGDGDPTASETANETTNDEEASRTLLTDADDACGTVLEGDWLGDLEDDGFTLVLRGVGQDDDIEERVAAVLSLECLLEETQATAAVKQRLDTTRALDGMQEATWGTFSAFWTYHPDNGLGMTVEESRAPDE